MEEIECSQSRNFLGLSDAYSSKASSYFHLLPVPYDGTSSYVPGSRLGPRAIIEASHQIELYDHELDLVAAQVGIATHDDVAILVGDPEKMVARVEQEVRRIVAAGGFPVVIGGEHTVALGSIRAFDASNYMVVSFDAHADLRNTYQESPFSHACFLRRAFEKTRCCLFGMRSISDDEADFARQNRVRIFGALDLIGDGTDAVDLDFIPEEIYLSIDLDVLDPSLMPSTGTPEPGGLGWYDLLKLLERVIGGRRVLGFDVVELCPQPNNRAPDFIAARLVYKLMGLIVKFSKNREVDTIIHGKEEKQES